MFHQNDRNINVTAMHSTGVASKYMYKKYSLRFRNVLKLKNMHLVFAFYYYYFIIIIIMIIIIITVI